MTTKKMLMLGAAAVVGYVAYRRWQASRPDATTGAAADAPAELDGNGIPYGTTPTTDTRKAQLARGYVPAPELYPTRQQSALLGIYS